MKFKAKKLEKQDQLPVQNQPKPSELLKGPAFRPPPFQARGFSPGAFKTQHKG